MEVVATSKFKRDIKRVVRQQKNMSLLDEVITILAVPEPLDKSFGNHSLSGNWDGWNECHLSGDWLLIYRYETTADDESLLRLARTGSHAELFE